MRMAYHEDGISALTSFSQVVVTSLLLLWSHKWRFQDLIEGPGSRYDVEGNFCVEAGSIIPSSVESSGCSAQA